MLWLPYPNIVCPITHQVAGWVRPRSGLLWLPYPNIVCHITHQLAGWVRPRSGFLALGIGKSFVLAKDSHPILG